MFADYHLHLENGPLKLQYLKEFIHFGRSNSISEFGISEHGYLFEETRKLWPPQWQKKPRQSVKDYLSLLQKAQDEGLPIKVGIEMDYNENKEEETASFLASYPWDYVIGSVHHLGDWPFDLPDHQHRWSKVDINAAYGEYFRLMCKAAQSGLFDILAHPDVIKVFGHQPSGDISHLWEKAARSMAAGNVVLEINTAGLRKPVGRLYPEPGFLRYGFKYRVPITISSDAHCPEDTGRDFDAAIALAQSVGYEELVRFTQRQRKNVPIGTYAGG